MPDIQKTIAIIFDMDGLMLDTETLAREAWFNTMRTFGVDLTDAIYLQVLGTTGARTRRIFQEAYGEDIPIEAMYEHKQAYIDAAIAQGRIAVKHGLIELLDELDQKHIPKAVGSSTARELVLRKMEVAGIRNRFEVIVGGDEVEHGKPAPDIFLKCAELLRVPPAQCMVLEDSDNGARAAHAAGMRCILVPDLKPPADDVLPLVDAVADSLAEVAAIIRNWRLDIRD
jgi:HAD superfamily hydrolase (TIGR01509 family)